MRRDGRLANFFLTYPGDVEAGAMGRVLGPQTTGEYLVVVEAGYDPASGDTRVGLTYAQLADFQREGLAAS